MIAVLYCLGCAATWAVATVMFTRVMRAHPGVAPQGLNLVKGCIALPCFLAGGLATGAGLPPVDDDAGWLALSALLGLVVADTGYFLALKKLGAARGVLFIPLVPVATALLAAAVLDEPLTLRTVAGIGVTLSGIAIVLVQKTETEKKKQQHHDDAAAWLGLVGGVVYALSQAGANVVAKHVLAHAIAVHVATLRIGFGAIGLFVASLITDSLPGLRPLFSPRSFAVVVVAAVVGTVGGMWLGSLGTQGLPVGVATTLCATTPLWALLVARVSGESISARSAVGAVVAVAGVVLLASASSTSAE